MLRDAAAVTRGQRVARRPAARNTQQTAREAGRQK